MVARGAGAAGPVLLACRQWDPLGLARRLPSLGVGAWRSAPLLPWRVQCPVHVCAALAAGLGGPGRYLVLCPPRFPLPAPRVSRCVWRAVPSGCPLPSLAGTPFHAVCAFRELGPVALLVFPACPLCVCALALPRRPLPPPPPLGGVARAPRAVPALGAGRAVPRGPCPSACPAPVPCFVWRAWGGAARSRFPPTWLGVCRPPWGGSARPGHTRAGGWGGGGGAACALRPLFARPGGPVGRGVALPRSVPLPSLGRQQSGCRWRRFGHGGRGPHTTPVRARRRLWARPVWCPGALVRVRLRPAVLAGAGGWGGGAGLVPAPLSGAAAPPGGGGTILSASGGWEPASPRLAGRRGGGGGGRAAAPLPSLWGAARGSLPRPPSRRRRIPPRRARLVGVAGPPLAPGAACLAGGWGGRGGP